MPASTVNLQTLHIVIPTDTPQRFQNAEGVHIDFEVTDDDPNPVDSADPIEDFLIAQNQGTPQLVLPDGSAPDMDAAVLTPYSLVTPPGVIRVG